MVTILPFGKVDAGEINTLQTLKKDLDKLSVGIQQFGGVLEKDKFISKLTAAIALIDQIAAVKTILVDMKTTLQAS